MLLEREEYVEQSYLFRALGERGDLSLSIQEQLGSIREEILSTTKLPMAIDFMASELRHAGTMSSAMSRLTHYFTPFQTYVVGEAENDRGRFDLKVGLEVLRHEADLRAAGAARPALFVFQFETLSRNRLGYDRGLEAISRDPVYDEAWREWITTVRRQVGLIDIADLIYVRSEHYANICRRDGQPPPDKPALFGEKEGKIALANRQKDPLLLFSALQRHLNYPVVPRAKPAEAARDLLPSLARRLERVEHRLKLLEEEQRGGIDLTKFYGQQPPALDE